MFGRSGCGLGSGPGDPGCRTPRPRPGSHTNSLPRRLDRPLGTHKRRVLLESGRTDGRTQLRRSQKGGTRVCPGSSRRTSSLASPGTGPSRRPPSSTVPISGGGDDVFLRREWVGGTRPARQLLFFSEGIVFPHEFRVFPSKRDPVVRVHGRDPVEAFGPPRLTTDHCTSSSAPPPTPCAPTSRPFPQSSYLSSIHTPLDPRVRPPPSVSPTPRGKISCFPMYGKGEEGGRLGCQRGSVCVCLLH